MYVERNPVLGGVATPLSSLLRDPISIYELKISIWLAVGSSRCRFDNDPGIITSLLSERFLEACR